MRCHSYHELRKALNRIWDIRADDSCGVWGMIKEQLFSFAMVVGIGFLLLVSLLATTVISGFAKWVGNFVAAPLVQTVNTAISLIGITLLFAIIYRFVPRQTLPWRRLWPGSFATQCCLPLAKICSVSISAKPVWAQPMAQPDRSLCCSCGSIIRPNCSFSEPNSPVSMPASRKACA